MALSGDNSYQITGKVCPPKLPMNIICLDNHLIPALTQIGSLFTEIPVKEKTSSPSVSVCALLSHANVVLQCDGLSHSSVVTIPYFFCNFCDEHTDSKGALLRHVVEKHIFQCELCEFLAFTRCDLIQHQFQKHLDAKEIQLSLTTKALHMNTSQLQRSLQDKSQLLNHFNSTLVRNNGLESSVEDKVGNSSQDKHLNLLENVKISKGHCQRSNNRLSTSEDEGSVSSTKASVATKITNIFTQEELSTKHVENVGKMRTDSNEFNICKRQCSPPNIRDQGPLPKKLKTGVCRELMELLDENAPSQSCSYLMPHFLDDSDTDITSSKIPLANKSHLSCQESKHENHTRTSEQNEQSKTTENSLTHQMPSFLTDPVLSPGSIDCLHSNSATCKSSTVRKILQWYDAESNYEHPEFNNLHGDSDLSPSPGSLPSSGTGSKIVSSSMQVTQYESFEANERSLSPNLSFLSGEKIQKQLEEVVSKSPGFLFLDSGRDIQAASPRENIIDTRNFNNIDGSFIGSSDVKKSDSLSDVSGGTAIVKLRSTEKRAFGLEHFLLSPIDPNTGRKNAAEKGNPLSISHIRENKTGDYKVCDEHLLPPSNSGERERYDILRKLLAGKCNETNGVLVTKVRENSSDQQFLASLDLHSSSSVPIQVCSSASHKTCQSRTPPVTTRPSDMSLKELLTQNVPSFKSSSSSVAQSICLVCGYCNFESADKISFQKHIEKCKSVQSSAKNPDSQCSEHDLFDHIKSEPCDEEDFSNVKRESCQEFDQEKDSQSSSRSFLASEMLKGLSDHYSESLRMSNDNSSHYKSVSAANGIIISESFSLSTNQTSITRSATKPDRIFQLAECKQEEEDGEMEEDSNEQSSVTSRVKNDDADYVYESDNGSSSYSSDSDHRSSLVGKRVKKKSIKRMRQIPVHQRDCSGINQAVTKRQGRDPLSKCQPQIHLTCLYCPFSTRDRACMREHLIEGHPENIPFAEATFKHEGKTLLYFCRGVNSNCTFLSCEGAEIFQHIKLCYAGHLDNFIESSAGESSNYSQALLSLGMASKIIDPSPVTFYCLRCAFSDSDFQRVASHVSTNHDKNVAGVLLVNKVLAEPCVQMVCITCSALMDVNQWAFHLCRKLWLGTEKQQSMIRSNKQTIVTFSGAVDSFEEHENANYVQEGFPDDYPCCSMTKENQALMGTKLMSSTKELLKLDVSEDVQIKYETSPPDCLEEESVDDVPVHFSQQQEEEPLVNFITAFEVSNQHGPNDANSVVSGVGRKASTGLSVLQNLLTAPKEVELIPRGFSLLENLLKPACSGADKEGKQPYSLINNRTQTLPSLITANCNTHSQHPRMVEILSRQTLTPKQNQNNALAMPAYSSLLTRLQENSMVKTPSLVMSELVTSTSLLSAMPMSLKAPVNSDTCYHGSQHKSDVSISIADTSAITPCELSPPVTSQSQSLPPIQMLPSPPPTVSVVASPVTSSPFTNLLLGLLSKSDQ